MSLFDILIYNYNLLLIKAQKLGYKNIAQAIGDKQFLEYKRKLNAKSK